MDQKTETAEEQKKGLTLCQLETNLLASVIRV